MTEHVQPLAVRDKKAAELLDIHPSTLRRHAKDGTLPAPVVIGGCKVWLVSELQAWLEAKSADRNPDSAA